MTSGLTTEVKSTLRESREFIYNLLDQVLMCLSLPTGDGPKPQVPTRACVRLDPHCANQAGWQGRSGMLILQSMLQGRKENLVVIAVDIKLRDLGLFLALPEPF